MIIHIPTKTSYPNRKEAKIALGGTASYNRAFYNGEFIFITSRDKDDIIL